VAVLTRFSGIVVVVDWVVWLLREKSTIKTRDAGAHDVRARAWACAHDVRVCVCARTQPPPSKKRPPLKK